MSSLEEIRNERIKKLEELKEKNLNPFPAHTERNISIKELLNTFDELKEGSDKDVVVAGRVMSMREHGKSIFFDVFDGTSKIQCYLKSDEVGEENFLLFSGTVDVGDFIEAKGSPFVTKKGEKSILLSAWKMLSKSLRPLPEEWYGFKDAEERFRKRYLDILMNEEVREILEKKAKFWDAIRSFLKQRNFLEVETPTLELTTGGAEATPFQTHHNDFDLDVYLRISVGELWQKRLMAAGIPRTFEIGRAYRNEGSSPEHVQEFTNMEFYAAYMNFEEGMGIVRELYQTIAKEVFGTLEFSTRGHSFDLGGEWKELDYVSTVEEMTGVNVLEASEEEMEEKLREIGVEFEGKNKERLTDSLWKYCRKQISGPAFLLNHPKLVAPLSKEHPDDPRLTKTFQVIIAGSEIGRAHAELNDPVEQQQRFEKQKELLEKGDTEAMMADWEFVEMLEYGMPPTFGFGFGERFFSFLLDKPIREVQVFPLMKPQASEIQSKKETQIAVVVINRGLDLRPWQKLNAVAHLNAAFGARTGKRLFKYQSINTAEGEDVKMNIQHAILIKQAGSSEELRSLAAFTKKEGLETEEYIREMIETTNDKKIKEDIASKKVDEIEYLGVLIFGPKSQLDELTGKFEVYS